MNTHPLAAGRTGLTIPANAGHATADREQLRAQFPSTAALLYRRRADLIGDDMIDRYVALQWLQWNGGALRVTVTGRNICDQPSAEALASDDKPVD